MPKNRNERLAADYSEMMKIQDRPYLSWIAVKGEPPYAEEYLLNIKIRTYVFKMKSGVCEVGAIKNCTVAVTLWPSYPYTAPYVKMLSMPPVFHPDWYSKGVYSPSQPWDPKLSLKDFIMRMLDTLRYDTRLIDTVTPANYKAMEWYMKNHDSSSLFPSDTVVLIENTPEETSAAEKAAATFNETVDIWRVH